jgi:hypothetical protein
MPYLLVICVVLLVSGCSKQSDKTQLPTQKADLESIARADQLAAHPADPSKPKDVPGVSDEQLQSGDIIEKAAAACMDAVEKNPDESRCQFELGRVLVLGGLTDDGREQLEAAASKGHGGAYFYLAQLEDDLDKVSELLEKAKSAGFKPAADMLDELTASEPLADSGELKADNKPVADTGAVAPADKAVADSGELVTDKKEASSPANSAAQGLPLRDQRITELQWAVLGSISDVPIEARDVVAAQVNKIIQSGQKVLIASYGTSVNDEKVYYFWYETAPADLATTVTSVRNHPLAPLALKPLTNAPPYSEEARQITLAGK